MAEDKPLLNFTEEPDAGMGMGPNQGAVYYGRTNSPPYNNRALWVVQDDTGKPTGLAVFDESTGEYVTFTIGAG